MHVLEKKASERMLMKKMWDYAIELKEGFVLRKRKIYSLLEKKGKTCVNSLMNNWEIRLSKLLQTALVFL